MSEQAVCIGGVLDGKERAVNGHQDLIAPSVIKVSQEPFGTVPDTAMALDYTHYRLMEFRSLIEAHVWKKSYFWVMDGLTQADVIQRLIDKYMGKL